MMSLSGEISNNILETDCNTEHSDIALKSDNVTVKIDFILVIILTVQNYTILNLRTPQLEPAEAKCTPTNQKSQETYS